MAILEHIRNSTLYKLYANASPEGLISNSGSGIDGITPYISILLFTNNKEIIIRIQFYVNSL